MEQMEGFEEIRREHLVCKLKKLLYGLKQSGREWYKCTNIFFVNKGFTRSHANHLLFVLQSCHYIVIVLKYIYDLIVLAINSNMINELKFSLKCKFEMSDLSKFHFFLKVHFERYRRTRIITMHQRNYIKIILEQFGMGNFKPIETLFNAKTLLSEVLEIEHEKHLHEIKEITYQETVGSLMYTMEAHMTRPRICDKRGKPIYVKTDLYIGWWSNKSCDT